MVDTVEIQWDGGIVTGRLAGSGGTGLLLAHGAGTNQDHPSIISLRDALLAFGLTVMTFNYPYTQRGARTPDRPERLLACHGAAADFLARRVRRLFLAGRSMGGRIGTHLAATGFETSGCVLYAYPLHPAGKPDRLRIDHLPAIEVPLLFFVGTRDALSRMDLFDRHVRIMPNAEVVELEGADHSFRGKGWTPDSVSSLLARRTNDWIEALSSGTSPAAQP